MTYLSAYMDAASVRERALKSLSLPIGLANPLWFAFAAAASSGAAWWLMTRWARPINLEAILPVPAPVSARAPSLAAPPVAPAVVTEPAPEPAVVEAPVIEAPVIEASVLEAAAPEQEHQAPIEIQPVIEAEPEDDDLTRLIGVGPRTAAALAARGVTRFAQLAAWSAEELAAFDAQMSLKGRSVRDGWIEQAKALAGQ